MKFSLVQRGKRRTWKMKWREKWSRNCWREKGDWKEVTTIVSFWYHCPYQNLYTQMNMHRKMYMSWSEWDKRFCGKRRKKKVCDEEFSLRTYKLNVHLLCIWLLSPFYLLCGGVPSLLSLSLSLSLCDLYKQFILTFCLETFFIPLHSWIKYIPKSPNIFKLQQQ